MGIPPDQENPPLDGGPRKLPFREQAKGARNLGLVLLALALIGFVLPGEAGIAVPILSGIFGATCLLIALLIYLFSRSWREQLRRAEAGGYLLHWRYGPEQWQEFHEQLAKASRKVSWLMLAMFSGSGLVFALLLVSDGDAIRGSKFLTFVVGIGGGALVGALFALAFDWFDGTTRRLMRREPAEVIVGDEGLFVTGQYWPWRSFGQWVEAVRHEPGPPERLVFTFHVSAGKYSSDKSVSLPVPPGRSEEAAKIAARFAGFD